MGTTIHSFTDLRGWQEAHQLVLKVYAYTRDFPVDERFGLTHQLRRAAVSISSNIAEGFSKLFPKEKSQFYTTALASLTEVQNQLLIAKDVGYLSSEQHKKIAEQTITVSKLINGLLKSVRSRTP